MNGQNLKFELNGINNQNFIMTDDQTGSWWQQITGEAILGPLKGTLLEYVPHDQLSFGLWKREYPEGRVLKPDAAGNMVSETWETSIADFTTVTELDPDSPLTHRTLILGLKLDGKTKAYPRDIILKIAPVVDTVGQTPVVLVYANDGLSARVFDRRIDDLTLDLFAKPDSDPILLVDAQTGSSWDFAGKAVDGPMAGKALTKLPLYIDYWFDWVGYHPETDLETFGMPIEVPPEETEESEDSDDSVTEESNQEPPSSPD